MKTKAELKPLFATGQKPDGDVYAEWIESMAMQSDMNKLVGSAEGITPADIKTQVGQTVSLTYNENKLVVSSSGFGGGMPIFGAHGKTKYEFTVGDASVGLSFLPIFAVQEKAVYNGYEVTKYLAFRSTNANWVIKETYMKNSDSTQVYNTDIVTIVNPTSKVFSTGDVVTMSREDGVIKLYVNSSFIMEYDMDSQNPAYNFCGGVWLTGFTGNPAKIACSNITISESSIAGINNEIAVLKRKTSELAVGTTKIAHFSFDDVILVFQDITTNSAIYATVFQNPFLGYLKRLHETYRATFSLYCFYTDSTVGSFTLMDCTDKFSNELKDNSHWLKFGIHGHDGTMNYTSTTAEKAASDYALIVTQLVRITGGIDSIDRCPRLSNFTGNTESLIAMRDSKCGIVGVLTSMDVRPNYNLTTAQNEYIFSHDKMYDSDTYLTYFKTSSFGSNWESFNTLDGANERNILESFLHEKDLSVGNKATLENFCSWASRNGYTFGFPMNLALI